MLRKNLLACGVLASMLYVAIDLVAAIRYPAYHSFSARAVSELMARGAPTERLVDPLFLAYDVLMLAFAAGVWMVGRDRRTRLIGGLLFAYAGLGVLGPTVFEMDVRGSGAGPTADRLHVAFTGVLVILLLGSVAVGASIQGRAFRVYSLATLAGLVGSGILTSFAGRGLASGASTPWVGVAERVLIGAFLAWVGVLAVALRRAPHPAAPGARHSPSAGQGAQPAPAR